MSFTYTGNPQDSRVDAVRLLIGDTDDTEALLQDEEILFIDFTWTNKNSIYYTASMCAEAIAAKFAREVTVQSDGQTLSASELQEKYLSLAQRLRSQHELLLTSDHIDVGGINVGEQPDPSVVPTAFGTGMHDFNEAGQQDQGDISVYIWRPEWGGW